MSQKRKISKYPPTEGETEDTTVIVEPTSAVQKRSRTTLSRGSKNTSEPNDDIAVALPADVAADAVEIAPPEVVVTTTTTAVEKVDGDYVNEDDNDDADMTDDVVNGDVAATNSPKKKSGLSNLDMPSHLNPSNPAHFDHFLFYLLVVRAESENPAQNICKEEYPLLYAWIQHVKKEYKIYVSQAPNCQLTAQQVLVLESLHVPLTSRGDDHWNRYYEFLVQYRNRHGHVLVPRLCEVPGLGDWVTDQRRQYKAKQQGQASQMTTARQELLEELEFVWHVRNRPEWEVRFSELLQYKEVHGDCRVPQHYKPNKSLGKWVAKQREQYKLKLKGQHSFLTPYREEKLNQAGFSWHVRNSLDNEAQVVMDEMINNNKKSALTTATSTSTVANENNDDDVADGKVTGIAANETATELIDAVKMEAEVNPPNDDVPIKTSNEIAEV